MAVRYQVEPGSEVHVEAWSEYGHPHELPCDSGSEGKCGNESGRVAGRKWPVARRACCRAVRLALVCGCVVGLISGCTPRVIVRANPARSDPGIRYYRPKPYLKVEPAEVSLEKNQTTIVPGLVRISLAYLPDFSEEYAIEVRSGLGIANVGIKLEDGWNLTEISQDLDSQADENLRAAASLLSAVGDVVPTSAATGKANEVSFTVPARNVPIGFYESIIGRDARGCKRLYGFRYVGFVPFAACPIDMGGQQAGCCDAVDNGLYGLSCIEGQMVFLPLDELATQTARNAQAANTGAAHKPGRTSGEVLAAQPLQLGNASLSLAEIEIRMRAHLTQLFDGIGEVRGQSSAGQTVLVVEVPVGIPTLPIRNAAEEWLRTAVPGASLEIEFNAIP